MTPPVSRFMDIPFAAHPGNVRPILRTEREGLITDVADVATHDKGAPGGIRTRSANLRGRRCRGDGQGSPGGVGLAVAGLVPRSAAHVRSRNRNVCAM